MGGDVGGDGGGVDEQVRAGRPVPRHEKNDSHHENNNLREDDHPIIEEVCGAKKKGTRFNSARFIYHQKEIRKLDLILYIHLSSKFLFP